MFYDNQSETNKQNYKKMLSIIGKLSNLFSENDAPYLAYRVHENVFCKYFDAENLARTDCSADAKKDTMGIGLKTWVGNDDQKVAEFGKLKKFYTDLTGLELVKKIAEYRNERIRVTKNLHGITDMIYHVVKRIPGAMQIMECAFDYIDIDNIKLIPGRGNDNNTYFTDGKHTYHFSVSKNTLYMIFDDLELMDTIKVNILDDPYTLLENATKEHVNTMLGFNKIDAYGGERYFEGDIRTDNITIDQVIQNEKKEQLCLPLYSVKKGVKFVGEKSGLNQWNAGGRKRNINEIYIPYQKVDRNRKSDFFPPRDTAFTLHMPDGSAISAKVCQEADKNNPSIGKSIMSNPNKVLGKWLLRDVFELEEGTVLTYEMLEKFGIDSVVFTKNSDLDYSIDFAEIGTYEKFYGIEE